jgi:hypothetical protein
MFNCTSTSGRRTKGRSKVNGVWQILARILPLRAKYWIVAELVQDLKDEGVDFETTVKDLLGETIRKA